MRGRVLLILIGLGIGLEAWLYSPAPALACTTTTPPPGRTFKPDTIAFRVSEAEVVLEGTVIKQEPSKNDQYLRNITVQVDKYYKGSGPGIVQIDKFGNNGADCRSTVNTNSKYIYYANGTPNLGLIANYSQAYHATETPDPTIIAVIIAATGQQPTLPTDVTPTATPPITTPTIPAPTPTPTPSITRQTETGTNSLVWIGVGIVVILGGGFFLLAKRRR